MPPRQSYATGNCPGRLYAHRSRKKQRIRICVTSCHTDTVTLHYETKSNGVFNRKKLTTMGIAYKIRCQHCNTEFDYCEDQSFGMLPRCVGCDSYVEMERPIRCPACHKRLNTSQEEFDRQVQTVMMWD